jgi:hypothetical protein
MNCFRPVGLAFMAVASASIANALAPLSPKAVIAASKKATGGSAWDRQQGCYEEGTRSDGAIPYKTWLNLKRYGIRVESTRGGITRVMGFNGKQSWKWSGSGAADVRTDAESVSEAIVTAYLSNNGFYFPDRFPAQLNGLGEKTVNGRAYDVIGITPKGGRQFEGWFDKRTHLLGRVVDRTSNPVVTVEASDYRRAGKFLIAYALTVRGPDGSVLDRGKVTAFHCHAIDDSLFDPPPPSP